VGWINTLWMNPLGMKTTLFDFYVYSRRKRITFYIIRILKKTEKNEQFSGKSKISQFIMLWNYTFKKKNNYSKVPELWKDCLKRLLVKNYPEIRLNKNIIHKMIMSLYRSCVNVVVCVQVDAWPVFIILHYMWIL